MNKREQSPKYKPLANLIFCSSGFDGTEEYEKIIQKIEELGGTFYDVLKGATNYLISYKSCSQKAIMAFKKGICILSKDWILSPESAEKYENIKMYQIPCFYNVIFYLFGFNDTIYEEMKKTIYAKGGIISQSPINSDIIIFKTGLVFSNNEQKEIEKLKHKIVTEIWYYRCLAENKFLPPDDDKQFQISSDIIETKYNSIFLKLAAGDICDNPEDVDIIQERDDNSKSEKDNINVLFFGKIFYISNLFEEKSKFKLMATISFCNGIVYDQISPITNYIITSDLNEGKDKVNGYNDIIKPNYVTFDWIFECIEKNEILDPSKYRPIPKEYYSLEDLCVDADNIPCDLRRKNALISSIFKDQSFTIFEYTYTREQVELIKEKILENSGKIYENKGYYNTNIKATYLIINDGQPELLNKILDDLNKAKSTATYTNIIVSHRFVDLCIEKGKCELDKNYYASYPCEYDLPRPFFIQNDIEVYIPSSIFKFEEKRGLEHLVETLGGHCDNSKEANYIIVKEKTITKKAKKSLQAKSNKKAKLVLYEWIIECLVVENPDENKFSVSIEDDKK